MNHTRTATPTCKASVALPRRLAKGASQAGLTTLWRSNMYVFRAHVCGREGAVRRDDMWCGELTVLA
jgi:hypothetical protein